MRFIREKFYENVHVTFEKGCRVKLEVMPDGMFRLRLDGMWPCQQRHEEGFGNDGTALIIDGLTSATIKSLIGQSVDYIAPN